MRHSTFSDLVQPRSISKRELYALHEKAFRAVTECYSRTKRLPPVIAHPIDPDPTSRSEKLSLSGIEFIADVERITAQILANNLEYQAAWFCLVDGQPVSPTLAQKVITLCGRVYAARGMQPWEYFQHDKYAHRRPL